MTSDPNVTVVIPTRGRPELLRRAIESVLSQTVVPKQIVVVVDGPDHQTAAMLDGLTCPPLTVALLDRSRGASGARNVGVELATGDWVAFLDDDDEWLPAKLERQLAVADPDALQLLACGVVWHGPSWQESYPKRAPREGEVVGDYLFVRTVPGEGMLCTPTLMVRRDLAAAVPFDESLRVHEDYDWCLRVESKGATLLVVPEPLVVVHAEHQRATTSADRGWRASLGWVRGAKHLLTPAAYSGFILTEVARTALHRRSLRTSCLLLREALRGRPRSRDLARFALMFILSPQRLSSLGRRLAG